MSDNIVCNDDVFYNDDDFIKDVLNDKKMMDSYDRIQKKYIENYKKMYKTKKGANI